MPTIELCLDGNSASSDVCFDDLTPDLIERSSLIWIDVDRSEREGLKRCAELFGLHSLAVESALLDKERAQITIYEDMLFLEFYGLQTVGAPAYVELNEISIFVGDSYVITVRSNGLPTVDHIWQRWTNGERKVHRPSASLLLHSLLDSMVDDYFPVVDEIGEQIEALEDRLMDERA